MTASNPAATGPRAAGWHLSLPNWRQWARWAGYGVGGVALVSLLGLLVLWFTLKTPKDLPSLRSSVVVDAKGRPLSIFSQSGFRQAVPLSRVAPVVSDALVSAEDRRFYHHGGVDPVGVMRAVWRDVAGGHTTQGGSTITQQLIKNSYLTPARTPWRKAKEAVLSIKYERTHTKREILERYLNLVYFGRGAYGIEAAAHAYFNTSAAHLDTGQAAFLVGLLRSPETAEPSTHPRAALARRDRVLAAMVANHKLAAAAAGAIRRQPLNAIPRGQDLVTRATTQVAPWFVELVREEVVARFGEGAVYSRGLRITTTLDLDQQKAAEQAVAATLNRGDDPQVALVALDRTGGIRAYVGGRDYAHYKVDLARGRLGGGSGRQAGSAFKPFVLAADAEQGGSARQVFPAPAQLTLSTPAGPWTVRNFENADFGSADLVDATAHSINTVFAQLVLQVGPARAVALAHAAGIRSDLPVEPSITLGTADVSPLEMADAYLTFARDGEQVDPFAVAKVQSFDGQTLYQASPKTTTAMKPDTAHLVDFALQQVVAKGTGTAAALSRPAAGKTGTTENNTDAWFAGYTPDYAAVVWMGYPEGNDRPMSDVHGISVTGGTLPARLWHDFMTKALVGVAPHDFPAPPQSLLSPATPPSTTVATTSMTTGSPTSSTTTTEPVTTPTSTVTTTTPTTAPATTEVTASPATTTATTTAGAHGSSP